MISALRSYLNALPGGYRLLWYDVEQVIGQGAFGITYVANDINLSRKVAIKEYMPAQLATRAKAHAAEPISADASDQYEWGKMRFLDEARILADVEHPNIVRVLSVFETNNTAYMVMQYERGESLDSILKRHGSLDEPQVLEILHSMMNGLEFIHGRRIIHRDVKPGNIYVREDGPPVLLDFGSARRSLENRTARLTSLVTPGYAPIEQYGARADKQGPWTDIYGLGATLYRTMTGEPPPDAIHRSESIATESRDTYCTQHREIRHRYSDAMLAAINDALAFSPHDRPQSIADWRARFPEQISVSQTSANLFSVTTLAVTQSNANGSTQADLDHEVSTKMPTVTARRRRGKAAVAVLTASAAIILAVGWYLRPFGGPGPSLVEHQSGSAPFEAFLHSTFIPPEPAPAGPALNGGQWPIQANEDDSTAVGLTPLADFEVARDDSLVSTFSDRLPTPSNVPLSADQDVSSILSAAENDVRALRLTRPAGANALEKFRLVLLLEPGNSRARRGIDTIVQAYVGLVDNLLAENRFDEATVLLDRARGIIPEHPAIAAAENKLDLSRFEHVIHGIATSDRSPSPAPRLAGIDSDKNLRNRADDFVRQISGD